MKCPVCKRENPPEIKDNDLYYCNHCRDFYGPESKKDINDPYSTEE